MESNEDTLTFPNGDVMKDKNGKPLCKGMDVTVPEPDGSDMHNFSFVGTIDSTHDEYITVRDGDDEYFDIEPHRLEIYVEYTPTQVAAFAGILNNLKKS